MCWSCLSLLFLRVVPSAIFGVWILHVLGYRVGTVAPVLPVWELLQLVLLVINVFCRFLCPFGVFYVLPKF